MSQLNLNYKTPLFKEFNGQVNTQMRKLIREGRTPLSVAQIMQCRLEVLTSNSDEVKHYWLNDYFDTGDGIFYHPDGRAKIVLGAEPIRNMTSKSKFYKDYLALGNDREFSIAVYNSLDGTEFDVTSIGLRRQIIKSSSKRDIKNNPVWNALVPNKALLSEYVNEFFGRCEDDFDYRDMMGIFIRTPKNIATGSLWSIHSVNKGSVLFGNNYVKDLEGHLIGATPKALDIFK